MRYTTVGERAERAVRRWYWNLERVSESPLLADAHRRYRDVLGERPTRLPRVPA
jgi:hypothetical protein